MKSKTMRIGEVAAQSGVNIQTLRYYERRGILSEPERGSSGYREYSQDAVRLIRFIKQAQDLGFTLNEIDELIKLRKTTSGRRNQTRNLAAAKIEEIDEKIRQLQSMRLALGLLINNCNCSNTDLECPILEALDDIPQNSSRRNIHVG